MKEVTLALALNSDVRLSSQLHLPSSVALVKSMQQFSYLLCSCHDTLHRGISPHSDFSGRRLDAKVDLRLGAPFLCKRYAGELVSSRTRHSLYAYKSRILSLNDIVLSGGVPRQ